MNQKGREIVKDNADSRFSQAKPKMSLEFHDFVKLDKNETNSIGVQCYCLHLHTFVYEVKIIISSFKYTLMEYKPTCRQRECLKIYHFTR